MSPMRIAVLVGSLAAGCASQTVCDNQDEFNCVQRGGPAEAVGTAVAATATWGAVGCTVNGCGPGYLRCNEETGLCERIPCGEGHPACPSMYECDDRAGYCK